MGAGGPPFAYFAAAGIDDFNHDEVRALAERLAGARVPVRLAVFAGPHAWPPTDVCGDALAWLTMRAMRDGLVPPDSAWIEARLRDELSRAGALDSSGKWEEASRLYAAIARDYSPAPQSVDAGGRAAAIESREPMRRLRARMRELAEQEREQAVDVQAGLLWLRTQRDAPRAGELATRLGVPALLRRAAAGDSLEAPSARRSLARIEALASFYEPRWYVTRGDLEKAARLLEVAASIAPLRGEACDELDALRRRAPKAVGHGLDGQCR